MASKPTKRKYVESYMNKMPAVDPHETEKENISDNVDKLPLTSVPGEQEEYVQHGGASRLDSDELKQSLWIFKGRMNSV